MSSICMYVILGGKNLKSVFSINIIMVTKFRDDLNVTTLKNRYSQYLIFYILLITRVVPEFRGLGV